MLCFALLEEDSNGTQGLTFRIRGNFSKTYQISLPLAPVRPIPLRRSSTEHQDRMFFISTQLANPGLDVRNVRRRLASLKRLDQPIRFIFSTAACVDGMTAYYDEMVWTRTRTRCNGHFRLFVFWGDSGS
jgi:hypothetical protein